MSNFILQIDYNQAFGIDICYLSLDLLFHGSVLLFKPIVFRLKLGIPILLDGVLQLFKATLGLVQTSLVQ